MSRGDPEGGVQQIEVASVRVDHELQPRAAINAEVVEDYASALEAGATFPPVTVFDDGETYWLADGFHRHAAAVRLKRATIACDVRPGTKRAAVLFAACANSTHGLRRSNADKRRAVSVLLQDSEWVDYSDRKIATMLGVDHRFVGHMREELGAGRDVRLVERGGTTFERRNATKPEPEVQAGPHPLRDPQTIAECCKLPINVLHRAGVGLTAAGAPCLEAGEQLVAVGLTGSLVFFRGLPGSPYDWVIVGEIDSRGTQHVGSMMRKAGVNVLLHQIAAGQCKLKYGDELRQPQAEPAPAPAPAPSEAPAPKAKSKIPAPKPATPSSSSTPAAPVPPSTEPEEPVIPDGLRRTWTILSSMSETVSGHLARAESAWKAGVKEILTIAKTGAKPVRGVDLAGMRKGATHDGDRFLYELSWVRRLVEQLTPYQACNCPPERQIGGSAGVADHCGDCGGRGWLARHEAQYVSDRRAKAAEG